MKCPKCKNNNCQTASKLAYREGTYFCNDCCIYFPNKKLQKIIELEIKNNV